MAEARVLKFCTKVDYIKSCQMDEKSPKKGRGFAHVTHFCLQNVDLKKFLHRTLLAGINKIDDAPLFVSPSTVDASAAID